ncbi:hypothetical protein Ate01nite_28360 [Actinoplanes teichomyceticus]|nr:hypothetical protein Ate01nite_28360 [Actinoplanes teichomyceticus]
MAAASKRSAVTRSTLTPGGGRHRRVAVTAADGPGIAVGAARPVRHGEWVQKSST